MKVVIYVSEDSEGITCQRMTVDGKRRAYVGHPEPEDAIIGRDLVSCTEMARMMEEAHAAGIRGEQFTVESVAEKDE